jgi:UDP:flavonoid glycosyltransferase YjiC (YdhE family)
VRILFSFAGGRGHAEPLVPLARAARLRGHDVAFAGRGSVVDALAGEGFELFATARPAPPERVPLVPFDPVAEDGVLRDGFAGSGARRRAAAIGELCERWEPEIVVCDELDFGAMVAAERLGLPRATVLVIASGSFVRKSLVREPLAELRAEHGLPPDPGLSMLSGPLVLSPFPPELRDPAFPLPGTAVSFRAVDGERAADAATVYVTLGTVFNVESGDLFSRVLAGLAELAVQVVVTVGAELDPAELEPVPAKVRVERFVPQTELLPHCTAVVCHGGSGSVLGALAHGLPLVVVPIGADQPRNAARCEQLGVGRVLDPIAAAPDDVRDAVAAVLAQPSYRAAAERVRDAYAALPGPGQALELLERLADPAGAR